MTRYNKSYKLTTERMEQFLNGSGSQVKPFYRKKNDVIFFD